MTNLQTASSAQPSVLVAQYVPATGAAQYTAPSGTTTQITSAFITNTDTVAQTVTVSIVKSGGTAGGSNRVLPTISLAAGATLDLGEIFLGDGDFIWAEAVTASKVTIILTGIEFSNATGAVLSGIQDDAIGTGGRGVTVTSVSGTNAIGSGNNRYLIAALAVAEAGVAGWSTYDTLTVSCTDGPMTRLVSIDMNPGGGGASGSVHLFGKTNPTSNSTQTITANVSKAGINMNLILESMSLSGVASTTGAASSAPTASAALNLAVSSAIGHRPVFACAFDAIPQDFKIGGLHRIRGFNGFASGANTPNWLALGDGIGAASVSATTSNADFTAAVGIDLVPA